MPFMSTMRAFQRGFHALSLILLVGIAAGAVAYTVLSAFGVVPWLTFSAQFGETIVPQAGMYTQIAATVLLAALFFFIPSSSRIMTLDRSHRSFALGMDDVAHAYHICHTADRQELFTLSSEFDSVRERLTYLRDHPELDTLEPDVLELAAQMSHTSKHLAEVYNDDKVKRAKTFLQQRQEEAEAQQDRFLQAQHACREIKRWGEQVELEESMVASQMSRLEEDLANVLPLLGFDLAHEENNVVPMGKPAAE